MLEHAAVDFDVYRAKKIEGKVVCVVEYGRERTCRYVPVFVIFFFLLKTETKSSDFSQLAAPCSVPFV